MRFLLFIAALLTAPVAGHAQSQPGVDLKTLFEKARALGGESELRGDIADRLGFGDHPLPITDLVIVKDGVQHAVNAFIVGDKGYILFNSHLRVPEVYLFVKAVDGTMMAGIHGKQFQPITSTVAMTPGDAAVIAEEEAFWAAWLADGAKPPPS